MKFVPATDSTAKQRHAHVTKLAEMTQVIDKVRDSVGLPQPDSGLLRWTFFKPTDVAK
jgi:hypothetical protein